MTSLSPKEKLKQKFSEGYVKYYKVKLFSELGYKRKACKSCGRHFWTLDPERSVCPNQPCQDYEFISNPPTKKRLDYIETWSAVKAFFEKNGHHAVDSYPVVCRWFPGLYFTVASIVAFQRSIAGRTVFEMPYNPLVIPQSCLRFNDIPNVGVTGRHLTNFVMVGQHSLYDGKVGYWKDRCIDLDFRLLTEVFGIKPEEINWVEDVWVGPAAFGYSLEYFVRGLELGNAVFTEFVGTPAKYSVMKEKVIDMGAGLERFAWITQGTPTCYDAIFGPVLEKMKKHADYDRSLFARYSKIAGSLNMDEAADLGKAKEAISRQLGLSEKELIEKISKIEALYAIADHAKTLLYAITDGALPSNVGGGYNLRIVLRRALGFLEEYGFPFDLPWVCREHAKYLKPLNPRVNDYLDEVEEILKVEEERYKTMKSRGGRIIESVIRGSDSISTDDMIKLYESHGITPEFLTDTARQSGITIDVPADFYEKLSGRHMDEKTAPSEDGHLEFSGLPPTKLMFYGKEKESRFEAKVLKVVHEKGHTWVVLDQTLFYPVGGGEDCDNGRIDGKKVDLVRKFGSVVGHRLGKVSIRKGETVKGEVDMERRTRLTQHHTAVHIINGAARSMFGNHIWQAGADKTAEKAHLDITHYEALSTDDIERLEKLSLDVIARGLPVEKKLLPRGEAEAAYGMRIYQGGAIPDNMIRIVDVKGWDVEACAGTHADNTSEVGLILITGSERIQDGIDRIVLKAGKAADEYADELKASAARIAQLMNSTKAMSVIPAYADALSLISDMRRAAAYFSVNIQQLEKTVEKFCSEISGAGITGKAGFDRLEPACAHLFGLRKRMEKELKAERKKQAHENLGDLLEKAKDGVIIDCVEMDMKGMIELASKILEGMPSVSVLLSNNEGFVLGMSRTLDMGAVVGKVCAKLGGKGGGKKDIGQGKIADGKKLLTITPEDVS